MTRTVLAAAAVVVVAVFAFRWLGPGPDVVTLDLIEAFPSAKQEPAPASFAVVDATLGDDTRQAILVSEPSRITWRVDVPEGGWLRLGVGLSEDAWQIEGDGVLFQIGVSDGTAFTEIFSLVVNPFSNPADRGWHNLVLDLDEYSGQPVEVIFNTRASPPTPPNDDRRGDLALWGMPRVVSR